MPFNAFEIIEVIEVHLKVFANDQRRNILSFSFCLLKASPSARHHVAAARAFAAFAPFARWRPTKPRCGRRSKASRAAPQKLRVLGMAGLLR